MIVVVEVTYARMTRMTDTKRQEKEKNLHQFILVLDDIVFNTVTSQILNMDSLPIFNNAMP